MIVADALTPQIVLSLSLGVESEVSDPSVSEDRLPPERLGTVPMPGLGTVPCQ